MKVLPAIILRVFVNLALALPLFAMQTVVAEARVTVCDHSSQSATIAAAYRNPGKGEWVAFGWKPVAPGRCLVVANGSTPHPYYLRVQFKDSAFDGSTMFCVMNMPDWTQADAAVTTVAQRKACLASSGLQLGNHVIRHAVAGFFRADPKDQPNSTVVFTNDALHLQ